MHGEQQRISGVAGGDWCARACRPTGCSGADPAGGGKGQSHGPWVFEQVKDVALRVRGI